MIHVDESDPVGGKQLQLQNYKILKLLTSNSNTYFLEKLQYFSMLSRNNLSLTNR